MDTLTITSNSYENQKKMLKTIADSAQELLTGAGITEPTREEFDRATALVMNELASVSQEGHDILVRLTLVSAAEALGCLEVIAD